MHFDGDAAEAGTQVVELDIRMIRQQRHRKDTHVRNSFTDHQRAQSHADRVVGGGLLPALDRLKRFGEIEIFDGVVEDHAATGAAELLEILRRQFGGIIEKLLSQGGVVPPIRGEFAEGSRHDAGQNIAVRVANKCKSRSRRGDDPVPPETIDRHVARKKPDHLRRSPCGFGDGRFAGHGTGRVRLHVHEMECRAGFGAHRSQF